MSAIHTSKGTSLYHDENLKLILVTLMKRHVIFCYLSVCIDIVVAVNHNYHS